MYQDKLAKNETDRSRSILIASGLLLAITLLGFIQWATAFRGDLLWILMGAMGFVLGGAIILMLPSRALSGSDLKKDYERTFKQDWLAELHNNDRHIIGSRMYRVHKRHE